MIKLVLNQVIFGGMIIMDLLNHIIQVMNIVADTIILRINNTNVGLRKDIYTSLFYTLTTLIFLPSS